jgi:hypothetical protein
MLDIPNDGVITEEESKCDAATDEAEDGGTLARRAVRYRGYTVYAATAHYIGTCYV